MLEGKNADQAKKKIGSIPISFFGNLFTKKILKSKNGISRIILCILVFVFICQCASESVRENPRTMLYESAKQGNIQGVRAAIEQGGATPDYKGHNPYVYRFLALTNAMKLKDVAILKLLLESGIHPDELNNNMGKKRPSALIRAASDCNLDAVKLLLSHGADVNYECEPYDGAIYVTNAYQSAWTCENKQILKIIKNPSLAMDKKSKGNSQLSSADFTETVTLKNGQTITSVKTKIAGDTIVVDYPNGNTKVYKKAEVKGVERN